MGVQWYLAGVLICIFIENNGIEHLFTRLDVSQTSGAIPVHISSKFLIGHLSSY